MPYDYQKLKGQTVEYDEGEKEMYEEKGYYPKKKKKAKKKAKKSMQLKKGRAGSYLTTRGQKQRITGKAFDYTME